MKLPNYVSGQWSEGAGPGEPLIDPVTGDELARISSHGIDLAAALEYARSHGGPALRQLTYAQRADLLGKIADALAARRLARQDRRRASRKPRRIFSALSPEPRRHPGRCLV